MNLLPYELIFVLFHKGGRNIRDDDLHIQLIDHRDLETEEWNSVCTPMHNILPVQKEWNNYFPAFIAMHWCTDFSF